MIERYPGTILEPDILEEGVIKRCLFDRNEVGRAQTPPPARFNKKAALWDALLSGGMTMAALKQVNAQAAKLIEDWAEQGWIETTEAAKPVLKSSEFQLNANQQQASDEIQTLRDRKSVCRERV